MASPPLRKTPQEGIPREATPVTEMYTGSTLHACVLDVLRQVVKEEHIRKLNARDLLYCGEVGILAAVQASRAIGVEVVLARKSIPEGLITLRSFHGDGLQELLDTLAARIPRCVGHRDSHVVESADDSLHIHVGICPSTPRVDHTLLIADKGANDILVTVKRPHCKVEVKDYHLWTLSHRQSNRGADVPEVNVGTQGGQRHLAGCLKVGDRDIHHRIKDLLRLALGQTDIGVLYLHHRINDLLGLGLGHFGRGLGVGGQASSIFLGGGLPWGLPLDIGMIVDEIVGMIDTKHAVKEMRHPIT